MCRCRFHCNDIEEQGRTENNDGVVAGMTDFSIGRDNCPTVDDITFYGFIKEIIEIQYSN